LTILNCGIKLVLKAYDRDLSSLLVMLSDHWVTTFLEFLETWKCQRIRLRSGKRPKLREGSGNLCSQGNLIAAAQQNNVPLYFIRTVIHFSYVMVTEIFRLINVPLFDILPAVLSGKVADFCLSG